jgi:hypothetical protein
MESRRSARRRRTVQVNLDPTALYANGLSPLDVSNVHLAPIKIGIDDGHEVEVASGLSPGDLLALNVGDGVEEGDPVQPIMASSLTN